MWSDLRRVSLGGFGSRHLTERWTVVVEFDTVVFILKKFCRRRDFFIKILSSYVRQCNRLKRLGNKLKCFPLVSNSKIYYFSNSLLIDLLMSFYTLLL